MSYLLLQPLSRLAPEPSRQLHHEGGQAFSRVAFVLCPFSASGCFPRSASCSCAVSFCSRGWVAYCHIDPPALVAGGVFDVQDSALQRVFACCRSSSRSVPGWYSLFQQRFVTRPALQQASCCFRQCCVSDHDSATRFAHSAVQAVAVQVFAASGTSLLSVAASCCCRSCRWGSTVRSPWDACHTLEETAGATEKCHCKLPGAGAGAAPA